MPTLFTKLMMVSSLLLCAAIFGFFYAWICSTMWGLDAADPRVAIGAMQAMNASVRNAVFAPAFFGTPFALLITAAMLWSQTARHSALLFGAGGIVYFAFGMMLTMLVNVPMNEALGALEVPQDLATAREIWVGYSPDWQVWNIARTVASGIAFTLALVGVFALPRKA